MQRKAGQIGSGRLRVPLKTKRLSRIIQMRAAPYQYACTRHPPPSEVLRAAPVQAGALVVLGELHHRHELAAACAGGRYKGHWITAASTLISVVVLQDM